MKSYKILKIITIVLLVAILSIASFCGIYKLKEYKVIDVVPEYLLGMEFTDSRIINLEVDNGIESTKIYDKDGNEITEKQEGVEYTEENGYKVVENKVNPDEKLTKENFKRSKEILSNRLKTLGADQYIIKQDENNGNIQIEMTEGDNTDEIVSYLILDGTFELIDNETKEVLIDTSSIKSTKVVYGQSSDATTVYLQIKFNKEGQAKLEEISKVYIESTSQTTNENGETEETTQKKEVAIALNGETYRTTYFGETITDGILNIALGSSTDTAELQEYALSASELEAVLTSGQLPIKYNATNYVTSAKITSSQVNMVIYALSLILLIMIIYLVVKFKGILAGVLQIGYVALLLLVLRYTNIKITIEGIIGILISIIINYMYIYKAFKNIEEDFIKKTTLKVLLKLIPIYIVAVIFTFNSIANISSLGMTLVWGIITMYLYNLVLTQIVVKTIKNK